MEEQGTSPLVYVLSENVKIFIFSFWYCIPNGNYDEDEN